MTDNPEPTLRDAASLIVVRDARTAPKVLMGQRRSGAAFMPSKFVFPGGAVDEADHRTKPFARLSALCMERLARHSDVPAEALIAAGLRELREETGLTLAAEGCGKSGTERPAPNMRFFFRAITPPRNPRRFDARFFLCDAACLSGDLDDFSRAEDELNHLQWVTLSEARRFDLPFITEVILAEVERDLTDGSRRGVPFFKNRDGDARVQWL